jgi:hypothetical protein
MKTSHRMLVICTVVAFTCLLGWQVKKAFADDWSVGAQACFESYNPGDCEPGDTDCVFTDDSNYVDCVSSLSHPNPESCTTAREDEAECEAEYSSCGGFFVDGCSEMFTSCENASGINSCQ